jgi:HAD superfamily hydrolase (TIGR01549 family)
MTDSSRFIDQFDVILLDQGRTFLFDCDRFGPEQDYYASYRRLGGSSLQTGEVRELVETVMNHMFSIYRSNHRLERFPTVHQALQELKLPNLPAEEHDHLENLIADHETGHISPRHVHAIQTLAQTHRLGIVSNIFARSRCFVDDLKKAGIYRCFEHIFWSSDHGWIKPSPRIFPHMLENFGSRPEKTLMVGDNPRRDIEPAAARGCATAWVANGRDLPDDLPHRPDAIVQHLADLLTLT